MQSIPERCVTASIRRSDNSNHWPITPTQCVGFTDVIHTDWLRMFNQHELHWLINGHQGGLDLIDLRENTKYGGGYDDRHPAIELFWEVVEEMTVEEQKALLKFATSCSRVRTVTPTLTLPRTHTRTLLCSPLCWALAIFNLPSASIWPMRLTACLRHQPV